MEKIRAIFKGAWPYQKDKMNLPVANVDMAVPFYVEKMGFRLESRNDSPYKSAILSRDEIQIGLAENGGDPTQDGCFFAVDNVENAFSEFKSYGLEKEAANFDIHKHGETSWKVFFVVAPDGLCYCIGERL
jgi:lactoylglutathione lyase